MTICVASLLGGALSHGHRLFLSQISRRNVYFVVAAENLVTLLLFSGSLLMVDVVDVSDT